MVPDRVQLLEQRVQAQGKSIRRLFTTVVVLILGGGAVLGYLYVRAGVGAYTRDAICTVFNALPPAPKGVAVPPGEQHAFRQAYAQLHCHPLRGRRSAVAAAPTSGTEAPSPASVHKTTPARVSRPPRRARRPNPAPVRTITQTPPVVAPRPAPTVTRTVMPTASPTSSRICVLLICLH